MCARSQSLPDVSKEEKKDHVFFLKGMSEQSASWSKERKDRTRKGRTRDKITSGCQSELLD